MSSNNNLENDPITLDPRLSGSTKPTKTKSTESNDLGAAIGFLVCGVICFGFTKYVGLSGIFAWGFDIFGLLCVLGGSMGICIESVKIARVAHRKSEQRLYGFMKELPNYDPRLKTIERHGLGMPRFRTKE